MCAPIGYFGIGPMELFIVCLVALLLFGNRLPSVMRSMGKGIVEFKKGVQGIEDDIEQASRKIDDPSTKNEGPPKQPG